MNETEIQVWKTIGIMFASGASGLFVITILAMAIPSICSWLREASIAHKIKREEDAALKSFVVSVCKKDRGH